MLPPGVALLMMARRLWSVAPDRRMPYQALIALAGILLVFNLLVWIGMPQAVYALLPDVIDRNTLLSGLLASWVAAGLCLLVGVLDPLRRKSSV